MRILLALLFAAFVLASTESRGGEIIQKTYYDSDGKAVTGYAYQSSDTWRYRRASRYYNSGYSYPGYGGYGFYGGYSSCGTVGHFAPTIRSSGITLIPTVPTVRPAIAPTVQPAIAPTVRVVPAVGAARPNPVPTRPTLAGLTRPTLAGLTRPTLAPAVRPSLAPAIRPTLNTGVRPSTVRVVPNGTTTLRVYKRPAK